MVAADKGYQSIVEALMEGGVDVNYKHQVYTVFSNLLYLNIIAMHAGDWLAGYFLCSKEW